MKWSGLTCHPTSLELSTTWRCWRQTKFYCKNICNRKPHFSAALKRLLEALYRGSHPPIFLRRRYLAVSEIKRPMKCIQRKICSSFSSTESVFFTPKPKPHTWALVGTAMTFQVSQRITRFIPLLSHLGEVALHSVACWDCGGGCHNS